MNSKTVLNLLAMFIIFLYTSSSTGQDKKAPGAQQLAEKLSNPVANLISVPFQNNTVWGIGENNGTQNVLNFQPVIPISISKGLNLINRIITPVIAQFNVTGLGESQNALGDIQFSMFLSPAKSKVIWGIGPIFSIPTATNTFTGSGRFSVGPTGVFLYQKSGWTMGALVNQYWSVGGNPDRGNQTQGYLQPFLSYSWKSGGGFTLNAEMTQNWKVKRTQTYMNLVFSGLTKLGKFPVQFAVGPRMPIAALPELKGYFGVRAVMTFIFPK
jgi:hypothetical protein